MKLLVLTALFMLSCSNVFSGQYVGLNAGIDSLHLTSGKTQGLKTGYKAGLNYGYVFGNGVRSEVECTYDKNNYKTKYVVENDNVVSKEYNNIHSWAYMVNVLYDLKQLAVKEVTPYFGIGVGYCQNTQHNKIKYDSTTNEDKLKDNRFAYQAILGLKYAINTDYSTALEYHYFCGQSHAKSHRLGLSIIRSF